MQRVDEQVRQGVVVLSIECEVLAVAETAAGKDDGHILIVVCRSIAQIRSQQNHRMIQKCAVRLGSSLELAHKRAPGGYLGLFDERQLLNLAGIQAVQTLSRLNRAHPGKDTTYILDFVNEPEEVLAAFKQYHKTAELESVTDPNVVYDLRAKLDALGYYDDYEVERVVTAELDPQGTQAQLIAAITPVADRLLKRYKALRLQWQAALGAQDKKA